MIRAYINATTKAVTRAVIPGSGLKLSDEYKTIMQAMTTKPTNVDKMNQNELVKSLKDIGVYNKAEFIDIFATHSQDASLINWANPTQFNPELISDPAFEQYKGYTGSSVGNKCVRTNFNPSTNATKITKDNFTAIIGVCSDIDETLRDFGASDGVTHISIRSRSENQSLMYANNSTVQYIANPKAKAHYAIGRNNSEAGFSSINDYNQVMNGASSAAIVQRELYACGRSDSSKVEASNKQVAYVMMFSALTGYEINKVIVAMEKYLRKYNAGLISEPYIYEVPSTKIQIPLTTIEGVDGETVHPSVINIGVQWNGYQYWMANTPYTQANEYPHIYASNDAVNWEIPVGLINPIFPQQGGNTFAPDTELYFENNMLYCFFKYSPNGIPTSISWMKSTDGINWTQKVDTNIDASDAKSPSIIKIGTDYYMYYQADTANSVKRLKSNSLEGVWGSEETVTVNGRLIKDTHLHIIKIGDYFWLTQSNAMSYSADGLTFYNSHEVVFSTESWQGGSYRPSIMMINDEPYMYYSYGTVPVGGFRTARVKLEILLH